MSTVGGVRVASIMPVPVITTGIPAAAMDVGVMDVSTGRTANVMHELHATSGEARLAHTAVAFSSVVGLLY